MSLPGQCLSVIAANHKNDNCFHCSLCSRTSMARTPMARLPLSEDRLSRKNCCLETRFGYVANLALSRGPKSGKRVEAYLHMFLSHENAIIFDEIGFAAKN